MSDYKPGYTEDEIAKMSERAQFNVHFEEAAQAKAAERWQIARRPNGVGTVLEWLIANGFTLNGEDNELFWGVNPPEGWTKSTEGFWTSIRDETGRERASQFFKGAWYDTDAFINLE